MIGTLVWLILHLVLGLISPKLLFSLLFVDFLLLILWIAVAPENNPKSKKKKANDTMNVCFIHPDLGIGGAESLVIQMATGLQSKGHKVTIYTSFCDPKHSYPETQDGTLDVRVHGNFLPHHSKGKFQLIKALIRFLYVSLVVLFENKKNNFDVIFVDQISATIPLLKFSRKRVVFYCHFPDLLLTSRTSILKWLYRLPFDFLEEITTDEADSVVVNSNFTKSIFHKTFKLIKRSPIVIYPAVSDTHKTEFKKNYQDKDELVFVSLNRYERKKNIELALISFALLLKKQKNNSNKKLKLIIMGGYSDKSQENIDHLQVVTPYLPGQPL
eukprot:TRINITY_DN1746_c0_g1_i1.p1 TRINITY_DN1746_c0_g1~~TRINITY_DN1746_c0_g1_i1.p1  ORF type:complete len:328 (+),score=48.26 TRINITY_DN1746_c0_g1_i1:28-1011(+)